MPSRIFLAAFFLSGAAGLIYQVCWVRILSVVFGNTVYAVSMVVAGFLAGLAIGSWHFGKKSDRMKQPLKMYIMLEAGIAASAVAVTLLINIADDAIISMMSPESVASGGWLLVRFLIVFIVLLAPTMLMGGTLPVMGRMVTDRLETLGMGISAIYAFNTYGGMAGAFISGFLLLPTLGLWGAMAVAVALNLSVAAMLKVAGGEGPLPASVEATVKSTPKQKGKKSQMPAGEAPEAYSYSRGLSLALFFAAGFCTLAFEVLWTRAFVVSFKSTVYLFSNLLTVFLLGMAMGSLVFGRYIDRLKDPMKLFGYVQSAIGVFGLLSLWVFAKAAPLAMGIGAMFGEMTMAKDAAVMFILMLAAFIVPTFLMGLAYPLITRVTTKEMGTLGENMGGVYAVGTVGGIAGSLVAGFALIPLLGMQNGIIAVSVVALLAGYAAVIASSARKAAAWLIPSTVGAVVATVVMLAVFGVDAGLGLKMGEKLLYSKEDVIGTVKVAQERNNGPLRLLVNSYQLATSGDVAVRFGHMPLILKPDAEDVLLISLGSGITAGSAGRHPLKSIDCVEIVPSLLEAQKYFEKDNHNITADKRFNLTIWDGRHFVRMTKKKYDVVISDLFQPDSAGEGSLYSLEHFLAVKAALNKGGAMAQWLPLYQLSPENLKVILRTFATAFENVTVWYGDINSRLPTLLVMGSAEPLNIRPDKLASSFAIPGVREDMIEADDPLSFLSFYVMDRAGVMGFTEGAGINTDNMPIIEFTAPRYIWKRSENAVINFKTLMERRQKVTPLVAGAAGDAELSKAIDRYFDARTGLLSGKVNHATENYSAEYGDYRKSASFAGREPYLALAVFDLGYMYYARRDFRQAAELFAWSTQINPALPEAYFYLGKSYQALQMKEDAVKAYRQLAVLRPDIAESLVTQTALPPGAPVPGN